MNGRTWFLLGVVVSGAAVGLGALGAHWFETQAKRLYADESVRERRVDNWETGSQYQMYHGLALLAVGLGALQRPSRRWDVAAWLFLVGVLLFSGSLYGIALSGITDWKSASPIWYALIAATPLGGTCLLIGWISLAAAAVLLPRGSVSR